MKTNESRRTHVLYSLPVCGASFFSTSPGLTCLRAGLSFFCFLGAATCVSVAELMAVGGHFPKRRCLHMLESKASWCQIGTPSYHHHLATGRH